MTRTRPNPTEWDGLHDVWTSERARGVDTRGLARRVRNQTRRMWLVAVGEVLVVVGLIGWSVIRLAADSGGLSLPMATSLWLIIAVATWLSWRNRAGVWKASAATPQAYLALSIERCRRQVRSAAIGRWVMIANVAWLTGFLLLRSTGGEPDAGPGGLSSEIGRFAVLLAATIAVELVARGYRRRAAAELAELKRLQE